MNVSKYSGFEYENIQRRAQHDNHKVKVDNNISNRHWYFLLTLRGTIGKAICSCGNRERDEMLDEERHLSCFPASIDAFKEDKGTSLWRTCAAIGGDHGHGVPMKRYQYQLARLRRGKDFVG